MTILTIDTAMAKRMVEAYAVHGASIVGQPGGWSVILHMGKTKTPLGAQRTNKPRMWRSLDRCVEYLKNELHIARFELLDATNYSKTPLVNSKASIDASDRLRKTHAAAAHDKWFREQVEIGLAEADDPDTAWVSHETIKEDIAKQRASLQARIKKAVR